ncbi:MAG: hypothetical protein JW940_31140 [Polyangiaceae bacterium]|nr:hypothetical protein [Polyangiaceae bacterium]
MSAIIRKQQWAKSVLRRLCNLKVESWHWLLPPRSRLKLTPGSPQARRLVRAGIRFPQAQLS